MDQQAWTTKMSGLEPTVGGHSGPMLNSASDLLVLLQDWWSCRIYDHDHIDLDLKVEGSISGWAVSIPLYGCPLGEKPFEATGIVHGAYDDHFHCEVVAVPYSNDEGFNEAVAVFRGRGGPGNLNDIISCFLEWALEA